MAAVRIMALLELLAWPVVLTVIVRDGAWPMLLLAAPVALFRVAVALQALFKG